MKIQKGIPAPINKTALLCSLAVGDSVLDHEAKTMHGSKFAQVGRKLAKRKGMKFSARVEEGGVRIWRIE